MDTLSRDVVRLLLDEAQRLQKSLMEQLESFVRAESPTEDKAAVDACVSLVEKQCSALGGKVKRHRQKKYGDLLEARFGPALRGRKPLMLLGHLDTVWPLGTLKTMPFGVRDGKVWGPGVLDMKAGVSMALTALEILARQKLLKRPVVLLLNSEEETGSEVSRPVTERIASKSESVFVLEPGQGPTGAYKTSRKGVGGFRLHVRGVAAHSGVDFERGHSAISELARLIGRIAEITDRSRGITVNAGVIGGGTRSNVIAAEAWAEVDVRISKRADAKRVERSFPIFAYNRQAMHAIGRRGLEPTSDGTDSADSQALSACARVGRTKMGFALEEAATGGGSDGNFTSALGIPTLDGMGAVGEGAHAANESIVLRHLAPRTALLAAMIANMQ